MTTTKIPTTLMLPLPPKVEEKQDLERYIRQLHKVLDEWHRVSRQDTDYAVEGTHEHDNKTILDAIEQALTTTLKAAYDSAVSDKHTHSNKATLDLIQEAFTTTLKSSYDGAVTHAGLTSGNPHSVSKSDVGLANVTNDAQVKSSDKASQAEAEAGTDDTKWMTPLKTKQAIDALAPGGSSLGSWVSKSNNTVYQAATDGFVCAIGNIGDYHSVYGYTDGSNPPTTLRVEQRMRSETARNMSVTFPVKKNDYWKVYTDGSIVSIYWIPLGS